MNSTSQFERRRLKFVASINDDALTEETDDDLEIQYIDIGNVNSSGEIQEIATYKFKAAPSRARRLVKNGDVIISTVRTYLKAIAPITNATDNLVVSTGFAVIRPLKTIFDMGFCKYALREYQFINEVMMRSTGVSYPAINASDIADIRIPLPPLKVQKRIADYLDSETTQIDALILEKERMLELLEEKRAALISQAVTKGLNPSASLKESGLEWLGKIPEHWELRRVKYFAEVGNGSTPNRENLAYWQGGTFPWLNSSVVNERIITEIPRYVTEEALKECHLPQIKPPAVLVGITGQGKTRGKTAILNFEATINQHVAFIKPNLQFVNCYFLNYLMDTAYNFLRNESETAGSTKGAMTCEQIANFYVPLPKTDEQEKILEYIESELAQYVGIETDLQKSLELLSERRNALITAAVTGQLEFDKVNP